MKTARAATSLPPPSFSRTWCHAVWPRTRSRASRLLASGGRSSAQGGAHGVHDLLLGPHRMVLRRLPTTQSFLPHL